MSVSEGRRRGRWVEVRQRLPPLEDSRHRAIFSFFNIRFAVCISGVDEIFHYFNRIHANRLLLLLLIFSTFLFLIDTVLLFPYFRLIIWKSETEGKKMRVLREHTHTHTHTYIYIYIYIMPGLCLLKIEEEKKEIIKFEVTERVRWGALKTSAYWDRKIERERGGEREWGGGWTKKLNEFGV